MMKRSFRNPLGLPRRRKRLANRLRRIQKLEQLESRMLLATYVVDTTTDLATGVCDGTSGTCSVRVALDLAANSVDPSNLIQVPAGTYLIDPTLGTFDYTSSNDLVFAGTGATTDDVVIDAQLQNRIFDLLSTGTSAAPPMVTFQQVTLQNGGAGEADGRGVVGGPEGGGVTSSDFDLVLDRVIMQGNVLNRFGENASAALNVRGSGTVSISNSVFRDNPLRPAQAALSVELASRLDITSSTFHNNSAGVQSFAAVANISDSIFSENTFFAFNGLEGDVTPTVQIRRSSFFDNRTLEGSRGTIVLTAGDFVIENVTTSNNAEAGVTLVRDEYGGPVSGIIRNSTLSAGSANGIAFQNIGGSASFESTIIDGDCFTDFNAGGSPGTNTSLGNNLDTNGTCGLVEPSDINNVSAELLPLADNGGPVPTHALGETSPAIDAGSTNSPGTDARGIFRPQDGDGDGSAIPDIGAFELEPERQVLQIETGVVVNEGDGTATIEITLQDDAPQGFDVEIFTIFDFDGGGSPTTSNEQTLTFVGTANETVEYTFDIPDDSLVEEDETVLIFFGSATLDTVDTSATAELTILDDDVATLTIEDITADESDGTREFSVTVDNPVDGELTVSPFLMGGSATLGSDFSFDETTVLTFNCEAMESLVFSVEIVDDGISEPTEFAEFGLIANTTLNVQVDDTDRATLTILDNDIASLSVADASADESDGSVVIPVSLDIDIQDPFGVDVFTTNSDGVRSNVGTLTFSTGGGETQNVTIDLIDDNVVEEDDLLTISFESVNVSNIDFSDTAALLIRDNDTATLSVSIDIDDVAGIATLAVEADKAVQGGFTVRPFITGGDATIGEDFEFDDATLLTFAGTVLEQQTFTVTLIDDDDIREPDETIEFSFDAVPLPLDENDAGPSGPRH